MIDGVTIRTIYNKLPLVPFKAQKNGRDVVSEILDAILMDVKQGWSFSRHLSIRKRLPPGAYSGQVVAGSKKYFHAPWVEWGTVHMAPRPAMTEAAERHREAFTKKAVTVESLL